MQMTDSIITETVDDTTAIEIEASQMGRAAVKQITRRHDELSLLHWQAAREARMDHTFHPSSHRSWRIHQIAEHLHRLSADLYRDSRQIDAELIGRFADFLSFKIESRKWR